VQTESEELDRCVRWKHAMEIWKRWEQVNTIRAIIAPIAFGLEVLGLILA